MNPKSINQIRLALISSYVQQSSVVTNQAIEEEAEASEVLENLAWLINRCRKVVEIDDISYLRSILDNQRA